MAKIGKEKISLKIVFNEKDELTGKVKIRTMQVNDINPTASNDDIYEVGSELAKMHKADLKEILRLDNISLEA